MDHKKKSCDDGEIGCRLSLPHVFLRNARGEMREHSEGRGGMFANVGLVGRPPPTFALLRTAPPQGGGSSVFPRFARAFFKRITYNFNRL